ncbi:MAG: phasin family protein [Eubacteriales bacterium]|nr:phasin family protein [Eubacteriales bacterium]
MSISEELRKLVLAGLGAASVATEKTGDAIETLAKRGEEVLAQGKDMNERLRHEIRQAMDETEEPAVSAVGKDEVLSALDKLTPEERKAIRDKLDQLGQTPEADA